MYNTSFGGRVRFGVYNRVGDLVEKGTQETLIDDAFLITSGFACLFGLAFVGFGDNFGLVYIRLMSYLVGGVLVSQFVGSVLYRVLMLLLSVILVVFKSDFYGVEV